MVAIMVDRLTITPDTGPLLELFCLAYADHQAARRELLANGSDFHVSKNGYKVQHAAVAVARQHGLTLERLADKLGFAPQTRETIDPVAQSRQKSAAEEWEERRPDTSKLVPFRQAQR